MKTSLERITKFLEKEEKNQCQITMEYKNGWH